MCDTVVRFFEAIAAISWLEVIKAFAPVVTAFIAFLALKNWRRQDKAKREIEFLDELIETTQTYVAEMAQPITLLTMAKSGMASHVPLQENGEKADEVTAGAIAFIEKDGKQYADRFRGMLEAIQPSTVKLRSLSAKGLMFNFDGYSNCQDVIAKMTSHFDMFEVFAVVIGSPSLNWKNPKLLAHLKKIIALDAKDIDERIQESNTALLEFSGDVYKRIYG